MEVVDRAHSLLAADRLPDRFDVEAGGSSLHQDVDRLLDQTPGGGEDQGRDQQADDRVDDRRAAEQDEGAGDNDADRAERVGGGVAEDALEVDVLALAAGEDDRGGDVAGQAEEAEGEDAPAVDPGGSEKRPIAAIATATLTATSSTPLTSAASTSERW